MTFTLNSLAVLAVTAVVSRTPGTVSRILPVYQARGFIASCSVPRGAHHDSFTYTGDGWQSFGPHFDGDEPLEPVQSRSTDP